MIPFIYGSQAKRINEGLPLDKSKDLDIICSEDQKSKILEQFKDFRIDFSDFDHLNNRVIADSYISGMYEGLNVCSMTGLAIFKRSHAWKKNPKNGYTPIMAYIHLKEYMTEDAYEVAMQRQKMTIDYFKERKVHMNTSNDEFFTELVTRKIPHDDLHKLVVKFSDYNVPKHELMRTDANNPYCSEKLWNLFSYTDKLKAVWEEATVIGIERFEEFPNKRAYYRALCMICTTLTQGWFRDFAIDNFEEVYGLFNDELMKNVKIDLNRLEQT